MMVVASEHGLLTNEHFADGLLDGIDSAVERVLIQVMTFDGDSAGLAVSERLIAAAERGVDVAVTVDLFAFRYVSDQRATDRRVADEVRETHAMFDRMEAAGIDVVYVGPWGPLLMFAPIRNHKKIFVIDDAAFIGGINVSDHNFDWFDFVVSMTNQACVGEVVADFHRTRRGERVARYSPVLSNAIVTNEGVETLFDELIESAETSILVVSPYALDKSLDRRLRAATAKDKTVITPQQNNLVWMGWIGAYVHERILRGDVDLLTFEDFFHAKFLLVDGERLLVGSSNFGDHSFRCNQEICALVTDRALIDELLGVLPPTQPLEHVPSRLRYVRGLAAATIFHLGITVLEKVAVRRVPRLTSRPKSPVKS